MATTNTVTTPKWTKDTLVAQAQKDWGADFDLNKLTAQQVADYGAGRGMTAQDLADVFSGGDVNSLYSQHGKNISDATWKNLGYSGSAADATAASGTSTGAATGAAGASTVDPTVAAILASMAQNQSKSDAQMAGILGSLNSARTSAVTQQTDPSHLSSSLINSILAQDSPLIQQERATALAGMNDRGLLNSSIATQAGQAAATNAAAQLAQTDSAAYINQDVANQQAQNAANTTNAQLALNAAQVAENARQFDASSGLDATRIAETAREYNAGQQQNYWSQIFGDIRARDLAQLDYNSRIELATLEKQWNSQISASSSMSSLYSQAMNQILTINTSSLDQTSKQTAIDGVVESLGTGLNMMATVNNVDLSSFLNF